MTTNDETTSPSEGTHDSAEGGDAGPSLEEGGAASPKERGGAPSEEEGDVAGAGGDGSSGPPIEDPYLPSNEKDFEPTASADVREPPPPAAASEPPAAEPPAPATGSSAGGGGRGGASRWRGWLARVAKVEDKALDWMRVAFVWLAWPSAYAVAIATAIWAFRHKALQTALSNNRVPYDERVRVVTWGAWALLALLGLYVAVTVGRRLVTKKWDALAAPTLLNGILRGLLALPVIAVFKSATTESTDPIWTALLGAAAAATIAASAYAMPALPERLVQRAPGWLGYARYLAPVAVVALGVFYAWQFSHLSVTNHHAMNTRTIDLGYYDNIFYQSIHGRPLGCTFMHGETHASGHFDPILVLMSPLYLLYPRAELLLVLQSVWLATGVVPVYLLARAKLGGWTAPLVLCVAYVVYPAMHGANMYEFHSLTLITPLVLWLLFFLETRRMKSYAAMVFMLWLCREDIPLLMCFVGLYAVVRRDGLARAGWITIAASLVYFVIVKKVFMTSGEVLNQGEGAYGFSYYFADLIPEGKGLGELLLSILQNPLFALKHAFANPKKILYLLVLFAPLGFLPFFAKGMRLMLIYGLFIVLAASREPVFQPHFQYSCLIFPIAFAAVPTALARVREGGGFAAGLGLDAPRLARSLVAFVFAASLLISWKFGAIVENQSFRGGFGRIARELKPDDVERYLAVRRMASKIPPDASLTVSNMTGPHVTGRAKVYLDRQKKQTDYVFVYERELKDWRVTWHQERIKAGGLVEIDAWRTIKLFKVVPERDVTWEDGYKIHRERSQPKKK